MSKLPPRGERLNIGLFGRRNVGKSSLLNALCDQDVSIVSEKAGTTTDAVSKIYELIPVGPVTFFDTAGIDDKGCIGELRIKATRKILNKVDIALLVTDEGIKDEESTLISSFKSLKIPFIVIFNKSDKNVPQEEKLSAPSVCVSAKNNHNIDTLKTLIKEIIPEHLKNSPALVSDLIKPYETIICVTPIDTSAPKGRLILPQVQVIRDILDAKAYAYTIQNEKDFVKVLENLKTPPSLVITDSQLIKEVASVVPGSIRLTTFSTIFARYKSDLKTLFEGAKHLETLQDGDKILISEACSHHVQEDDIARVKMPALIKKVTQKDVTFEWAAGINFPENLKEFKLVIHCGACMLSRLETVRRLNECTREGVPITNFGIALSCLQGVLPRVIAPFGLK